jgi:hypothetical protein
MFNPITFLADKLSISTGRVDNSIIIKFETGEYEKEHIAELMKLPDDVALKVVVSVLE